ncbi:MAG: helix-turn-helix transcriptional regulator, partial [Dehalococcoidia bacterium]|nr:helix-turn-helix transcriptional regulator [Dehalococcoidia bacterium]
MRGRRVGRPVAVRERDGKPLEEVLSAAEQRVFRELLTGASDEAIAERLDLGIATIRYHIRNSVRKMEVGDREELIALG